MSLNSGRWIEVTPSQFPWEQEALGFIRERLPDHDPYRAWSNFEFIAEDGSINEVDAPRSDPEGLLPRRDQEPPGQRGRRRQHLDLDQRRPAASPTTTR